jgi:hypothetical protein
MKDGVGVHGALWARATKNVKKVLGKKGIEKKRKIFGHFLYVCPFLLGIS